MKRQIRWTFLIGSCILFTACLAYGQGNTTPQKVTMMLDWFPNADHVPIYVAQQEGFFAEHRLSVELLTPADTNDPLILVAAGKYPFAVSYQPSVTIARSEGLPVKAIGVLVEHPLNTISFLKRSGIQTPADLKGKTVGYAVAPLGPILFNAIARQAGLEEEDYELINIGFNITSSLLTGKVDAAIGAYWNYEINELALEGVEAGHFPLEKHGIPDFYELVFITNDQFLDQNAEVVKRFMQAMQDALKFTKENPDEALAAYFEANPNVRKELDERAFRDTLPVFATTQQQSTEKWSRFADFGYEHKLISKKPAATDLFHNVLVEQ